MGCFFQDNQRFPSINFKWLLIKVHYFLMFGAIAGVTPFLTVIGKSLGLNTTAVGITYTLLPMSIFVCKPLFGFLADYIQNTKILVIWLITAKVVLSVFILFLNPIEEQNNNQQCIEAQIPCGNYNQSTEEILFYFKPACIKDSHFAKNPIACNISFNNLASLSDNNTYSNDTVPNIYTDFTENLVRSKHLKNGSCTEDTTFLNCWIFLENGNFSQVKNSCNENQSTNFCSITCDREFQSCLVSNDNVKFYHTLQFWIYMLLIVTSCCSISTAISLTDVSCYKILGEKREYYGQQRLFGTISTGVITLFSGYFNDLMSNKNGHTEYLAGFYLMIALYFLNMLVLIKIDLPKANVSNSIILDIKTVCKSKEFITFSVAVLFIGILASLIANYLFWFLTDLGANQTLLGLTIAVQCLVAEVPFFFFSGWFIKHLGYFNCLTCSFVGFAVRFGIYHFLENPWYVLPVELFHGLTYAVFYSSTTAFASTYAPPGAEATLLGLLCGIYDGLSFAIGSLLGGLSFNEFGGSQTFLIASCLSTLCIPATIISHFTFRTRQYKKVTTSENEAATTVKSDIEC